MRGYRTTALGIFVLAIAIVLLFAGTDAHAEISTSTNYQLDSSVGNSISGQASSTNYAMVLMGGQSVVGNGASGSYKLTQGYSSHLQKSIEVNVQPAGLLAYYPLDEPGGNTAFDASSSGFNASSVDTPSRQAGQIGGALAPLTSGTSQSFNTSATSALNTTSFTACSWVNRSAAATNPDIVGRADNSFTTGGMWFLGFNTGLQARFGIYLGSSNIISSSSVSSSAWHQICGSYDGSTMKLYVDGVVSTSQALAGPLPGLSTQPLSIGGRSDASHISVNQAIDEVKLFNRSLTDDEIKALYTAGSAGVTSGISFGTLIPGTPAITSMGVTVQADGVGYGLAVNQNQNLSSGANTISPISSSIAAPANWINGTTKGLGFTLSNTTATAIPIKWSSGSAYAALPTTATTMYSRDGSAGATRDKLTMQFKLDVGSAQPTGDYSNQVTVTGTLKP